MPPVDITNGVQAYRVTISTKGDVSPDTEAKFVRWAKKQDMCYCVAEKGSGDRRHIHALVLFESRRAKTTLHNAIWQQYVKPHHADCIMKKAVVINAAFDFKWRDEYLQKESGVEILINKWDDEHAEKYLPSIEEQDALVEAAESNRQGRAFHDHKMWTDLAGHFKTWYVKESFPVPFKTYCRPHHCLQFLQHEMLYGRMIVMCDTRRRYEKAIWLYRQVTMDEKPSASELQYLERWEQGQ